MSVWSSLVDLPHNTAFYTKPSTHVPISVSQKLLFWDAKLPKEDKTEKQGLLL